MQNKMRVVAYFPKHSNGGFSFAGVAEPVSPEGRARLQRECDQANKFDPKGRIWSVREY